MSWFEKLRSAFGHKPVLLDMPMCGQMHNLRMPEFCMLKRGHPGKCQSKIEQILEENDQAGFPTFEHGAPVIMGIDPAKPGSDYSVFHKDRASTHESRYLAELREGARLFPHDNWAGLGTVRDLARATMESGEWNGEIVMPIDGNRVTLEFSVTSVVRP